MQDISQIEKIITAHIGYCKKIAKDIKESASAFVDKPSKQTLKSDEELKVGEERLGELLTNPRKKAYFQSVHSSLKREIEPCCKQVREKLEEVNGKIRDIKARFDYINPESISQLKADFVRVHEEIRGRADESSLDGLRECIESFADSHKMLASLFSIKVCYPYNQRTYSFDVNLDRLVEDIEDQLSCATASHGKFKAEIIVYSTGAKGKVAEWYLVTHSHEFRSIDNALKNVEEYCNDVFPKRQHLYWLERKINEYEESLETNTRELAEYNRQKAKYNKALKSLDSLLRDKSLACFYHCIDTITGLHAVRDEDPLLMPIDYPDQMTEEEIDAIVTRIKTNAAKRYSCAYIGDGYCSSLYGLEYGRDHWLIPSFRPWTGGMWVNKPEVMSRLIFNMLLSLPIKQVRLTFVDLDMSGYASEYLGWMDPILYHNAPIVKEQELHRRIEQWQQRMADVLSRTDDIRTYNEERRVFLYPYEVVVLPSYPASYSPAILKNLEPLINSGWRGGITFILHDNHAEPRRSPFQWLGSVWTYRADPKHLVYPTFIYDHQQLRKTLLEYISLEARREEEAPEVRQDLSAIGADGYLHSEADVKVPIGRNAGREVSFRLDVGSHAHAFILGQSGSGKSVLLHNILANLIINYPPEELQLYLLDFKLGGVEFNRYQDIKHIAALLVDSNDREITLEILRDLGEKMRRRGEMMREAGVSNLQEYNQTHSEHLPQILLVADECHELFHGRLDKVQSEINRILVRIAKEGRSQGVHLILSTQTIASTNIPKELLNNISDHYLFKCTPGDSESLVRDSSRHTSGLKTGNVFRNDCDGTGIFRVFNVQRDQTEQMIQMARRKAQEYLSAGEYYFCGKQTFRLDGRIADRIASQSGRWLYGIPGIGIDLKQTPIWIRLKRDTGDNILISGYDECGQTLRTALELTLSMLISSHHTHAPYSITVLDCIDEDEGNYPSLLDGLQAAGVNIVRGRSKCDFIARLAGQLREAKAMPSIVVMLGQDRFRELRLDLPLVSPDSTHGTANDHETFLHKRNTRTVKSELDYLLQNGSEQGVHFIWHIDKVQNLLFEPVITPQMVFSRFKHLIFHRSAADIVSRLRLPEGMQLENLSDDEERLRAYYYNDSDCSYRLFAPFGDTAADEIEKFIKVHD